MDNNCNKSEKKIPVIVIFAPTASGKTALTEDFFSPSGSHFILNAEVVSADSMQVYKYMNIGTAKPEAEFCKKIPHHLIDIAEPSVQFCVSDFIDNADNACKEIYSRKKIPVVCGGTGFYIRNFIYGIPRTPASDSKLREQLKERIKTEGNFRLYEELKNVDPLSASKIHENDAYRICRALEIYYLTGKTRNDFQIEQKFRSQYDFLFIVLKPDREVLHKRIEQRVEKMFEDGLEKEFNSLIEMGYDENTPAMKAIGYHEFFESDDRNIIIKKIKHNTKKYAKKQFTYINDIPGSQTILWNCDRNSSDYEKLSEIITKKAEEWKYKGILP